ncbi:MAG: ATP-binding cassette domain-containing protein [Acidobacteria bacterium]|nr:ATP-binding cassette domain-containing protein [Acidobacteriota bacterium]
MSIVLQQLRKRYGRHLVVNDVSLEVTDGEFFVLIGPSGSGKSTILRLVAGLTDGDGGQILLGGRDVTQLPPQDRPVGLVFQHYALFRNMNAAENIEFPLAIRGVGPAERRRRRDELLELVGLTGLAGRRTTQLSGGQQQRVALARALAHRPEVLLLDEPFGALDAKIRAELRRTIKEIHRELGVTTIFVTHDQEEAFELGDRIGVMNFGRLLEVGPPHELYLRPHSEFVATFLGTANLMVGESRGDGLHLGPLTFPLATRPRGSFESQRVQLLFRPEDVAVKDAPEALGWPLLGEAVVEESGFTGAIERLRLRLPPIPGVRPIAPPAPFGGDYIVIEATRSQHQARRFPLRRGDRAWTGVRRIHALTHPGLSLLLAVDGSAAARAALGYAAEIARPAHARVTVLVTGRDDDSAGEELQRTRERLGAGLAALDVRRSNDEPVAALAQEAALRPYDLVVHPLPTADRAEAVRSLLAALDSNLLLLPIPVPETVPVRTLVAVAIEEPAKECIQFAGRLGRHFGAEATLLTALAPGFGDLERERAERFLAAGMRSVSLLGVPAVASMRAGNAAGQIVAALREERFELLVVGKRLTRDSAPPAAEGVLVELLAQLPPLPLLIVRTEHPGP